MPRERRRKQGEEREVGGKREAPVVKGGFRYGGYRCRTMGTGEGAPSGARLFVPWQMRPSVLR